MLARAGEPGPLWVAAIRQTAGRGRRGNVWTSEPGNLHASLLLTDAAPAAHLPELCFVVALALRDAVSSMLLPPLKGEGRAVEDGSGPRLNGSTESHVDQRWPSSRSSYSWKSKTNDGSTPLSGSTRV